MPCTLKATDVTAGSVWAVPGSVVSTQHERKCLALDRCSEPGFLWFSLRDSHGHKREGIDQGTPVIAGKKHNKNKTINICSMLRMFSGEPFDVPRDLRGNQGEVQVNDKSR